MLYDCVSCGRGIAEDARRCPHCGTGNAGHRAIVAHGARVHYSQPGWRERDAAKAAQDKASSDQAWHMWLVFLFLGAVIGGWSLGSMTGGVIGTVIGALIGAFGGFLVGGLAIVIFYD